MQNANAFCMGPGGGSGLPMKKADAFFMEPGEGVGDVVDESKFRFFN